MQFMVRMNYVDVLGDETFTYAHVIVTKVKISIV